MIPGLPALFSALLLSAATFDGEAALRHASALAALGPHPWGSPRAGAAAQYVAAELRRAGVKDVRLQAFEAGGRKGANVVAVLPGRSGERVIVGAHHDSVEEGPGAYDDGGGVGVLIETARVLARAPARPRTIVFVSFDGEEAFDPASTAPETRVVGARDYVRALGPAARDVVAAFIVEMCGWKGGTPVLHPIAYVDPLQPDKYVVSPGWVVAAALRGAGRADSPFRVGDSRWSWLYQPATRTVRVAFWSDDMAFLQSGVPAVFTSDSSWSAFYPWYHRPEDTADKLDAPALARMGRAVVGAVEALAQAPRGPARDPQWFAAFGGVVTASWLYAIGAVSLLPRLVRAVMARGMPAGLAAQAALFGFVLWRHPVVAVWVFLLPNLFGGLGGWRGSAVALVPLFLLAARVAFAWGGGAAQGLWLAPWDLLAAAAALALLWLTSGRGRRAGRTPRGSPDSGRPGDRGSFRRRGLRGGRARG